MRLGNGNESDSSAPTIRLATLIRGARTAAGGERARILGVGASTAASTPGDVLGSSIKWRRNGRRFVHTTAQPYHPPLRPVRYYPGAVRSLLKPVETAGGC